MNTFYYETKDTWDDEVLREQPYIEASSPEKAFEALVDKLGDELILIYDEEFETVYEDERWIEDYDVKLL